MLIVPSRRLILPGGDRRSARLNPRGEYSRLEHLHPLAITTVSGVLAGAQPLRQFAKAVTGTMVAGRPQSLWPLGGTPGAGTYNTTLNGGTYSSSSSVPAGAIPHTDPVSGNSYLARLGAVASQAGTLLLLDRIWDNQLTVNVTTLQSPTTPTWPARDLASSTNGDGVLLAIETSAAASATAAAVTVTYTNQAGTGSHTAGFLDATAATATIAGAFFRIGLQAGDSGVRAVTGVQFSTAWTTGTINLVAYRLIAMLELPGALIPNAIDALTAGFPLLPNGVVPFLVFIPNTTTASNISGSYTETQG